MTQIKIFEGNGNNESDVNAWLSENPNIKVLTVSVQPLHEFYKFITPPQICNQWLATTVIYQKSEKAVRNE